MARKKTSPAVSASSAAEPTEVKPGLGFEDGIVLTTTLVLVVAVILAYMQYTAFYAV